MRVSDIVAVPQVTPTLATTTNVFTKVVLVRRLSARVVHRPVPVVDAVARPGAVPVAEYFAFISKTSERSFAYADTLGDLALGTAGAAVAAVVVHRLRREDASPAADGPPAARARRALTTRADTSHLENLD